MKILITGASSGLGAELARQYATSENELILLARREEKLFTLRSELFESAKSVEIIVADVTAFEILQEKIKKIGIVDIVILNAGISLGPKSGVPTIESFKNLYDVNLLANHAILEVLLPRLVEQGSGKVVFISSLASLFTMPGSEVYSSSKRALNAYADGIRHQYTKDGLKVITILPGFIKSEMTDKNDFSMPFMVELESGVSRIKKAIDSGKEVYAFPSRFYFIIRFLSLLPNFLLQKIFKFM